jgi:hypothetical protein
MFAHDIVVPCYGLKSCGGYIPLDQGLGRLACVVFAAARPNVAAPYRRSWNRIGGSPWRSCSARK